MVIPQKDGSTITLDPDEIKVGSQIFRVTTCSQGATLGEVGVPAAFKSMPIRSTISVEGGSVAESLLPQANAIAFMLNLLAVTGSSWVSEELIDSDLFLILEFLLGAIIEALLRFRTSLDEFREENESQVVEMNWTDELKGLALDAFNEVSNRYNLIKSLMEFMDSGFSALSVHRRTLHQYWTPELDLSIEVPASIGTIARSEHCTASKDSSTLAPYLLTTESGTPSVLFQWFIQILPDEGKGEVIAYPFILGKNTSLI